MKKSKMISMIAIILIISVSTFTSASTAKDVSDFKDMPEDWSTQALKKAVSNGLIKGTDRMIMPKANLTRAQMATVINRAFGAERQEDIASFKDVKKDDWFYTDMSKAVGMETFKGSGEKLNPKDDITREQAFAQVMDNVIKEYINKAGEYIVNEEKNIMINTSKVIDDKMWNNSYEPFDYISWPAKVAMPVEYFNGSFNIDTGNYGNVPFTVIFRPKEMPEYKSGDKYKVVISNIYKLDGSLDEISFETTFFELMENVN